MADAKLNYEVLYKKSVSDLAALKLQADEAGGDANRIGALADKIAELAKAGADALAPPADTNAKAAGAPSA